MSVSTVSGAGYQWQTLTEETKSHVEIDDRKHGLQCHCRRGGISSWVDHPIFRTETNASAASSTVTPTTSHSLSRISEPASNTMRHPNGLRHLIASKCPPEVLSAQELEKFVDDRLELSTNYLAAPQAALNGDSPKDYIIKMVHTLADDQSQALAPSINHLYTAIAWSLFLQDVADDPRYSPHGYDHSITTARWMDRLSACYEDELDQFAEQFSLSLPKARTIIQLVGLLHDCGYPFMEGDEIAGSELPKNLSMPNNARLTKATHAVVGGLIFNKLVKPALMEILQKTNVTEPEALCRAIVKAIHLHSSDNPDEGRNDPIHVSTKSGGIYRLANADALQRLQRLLGSLDDEPKSVVLYGYTETQRAKLIKACNLNHQSVTCTRDVAPPTRSLDAEIAGDKAFATPCVKIVRDNLWLAFLLGAADNYDITAQRLGLVQGSPEYSQIMLSLYSSAHRQGFVDQIRTLIDDIYTQEPSPHRPSKEMMLASVSATSEKDIHYLLGLLAIDKVDLKKRCDDVELIVTMRPLPDWMAKFLPKQTFEQAGFFQIDRLRTAMEYLVDAPKLKVVPNLPKPTGATEAVGSSR